MSNVYINETMRKSTGLCGKCTSDRKFLDSLWKTNGKIHFNRTRPLEPFSDYRILEETQGEKGWW